MRIMFISDIHGTKTNLELIKNRYEELKCEKLVVLGDLYYIGPRNKMNEGYDIKYVQEFLSSFKDNLFMNLRCHLCCQSLQIVLVEIKTTGYQT